MGAIEVRHQGAATCFQASLRVSRLLSGDYASGSGPVSPDDGWCCPDIIGSDLIPVLQSDAQRLGQFLASGCPMEISEKCLGTVAALTKSRGDMPTREVNIRLRAMSGMLAEYPRPLVEAACRKHAENNVFFPALAELVEIIRPEVRRYERQLHRIRAMLAKAQKDAGQPPEPSEGERKLVAERLGALTRKMAGKATEADLALIAKGSAA